MNRRKFLQTTVATATSGHGLSALPSVEAATLKDDIETSRRQPKTLDLVVTRYGTAKEETVKLFRFNEESAQTEYISGLSGIPNPPFLIASKKRNIIYTVGDENDRNPSINAITFDRTNRRLTLLNSQSTVGNQPCFIALSPTEKFAVTANYMGTSISVFGIDAAGRISDNLHVIDHTGSGPRHPRQDKPHPHCIVLAPDGKNMIVPDLGTDRVYLYPVSESSNRGDVRSFLNVGKSIGIRMPAGTGPRHICFHLNGKYAYLISEFSGRITVFSYRNNRFTQIQSIICDTYQAAGSADIHVSPDGKFLYATNRLKNDGIAIFSVDPDTGTLTRIGYQATGKFPRAFCFSPDARFVLVVCRDSHSIQIFKRNSTTGLLTETEQCIELQNPTFALFV